MNYKRLHFLIWALIFLMTGALITKYVDFQKERRLRVNSHEWDKLSLILNQIEKNYVDDIDYPAITEKTIPLILKELDPHSIYLPPQELKTADEDLAGKFDGIGILFNVPEDTAVVISVVVGGPSERAGLLSGDRIIKVDNKQVAGVEIPQDSLVGMMRGPSGSKVHLTVKRGNDTVPFSIERGKITVKSVDVAYMINDTLGFIKLSKFSRTSHDEFIKAVVPMMKEGMTKLIFDLRDNPGGYFDQALLLSNEFLEKGEMVVYMEGKHRAREEFKADGKGRCKNLKISVLLNEGSASSSEIFAGAIQDNDRGDIYGRRSFGKGLVQEPINFTDNSGIRLTVARFYTPTGRCIQKPYTVKGEDYSYDIYERYKHGELTDSDSIPKNDSLKYVTPKGKLVYGGGGIIPDIFVPMDTTGFSNLFVKVTRYSLQVKFSSYMADRYRAQLKQVKDLNSLNSLFDKMNIELSLKEYLSQHNIKYTAKEWNTSKELLITQSKALIGRYSPLDDNAYYPIISAIDNVVQVASK